MATNYSKYINSTGTHYISNSGSDENGRIYGGKDGDQNGKEWCLRSWYNRPWTCVLRYPDPEIRMMIAQFGIDAALNDNIGYNQYRRTSYYEALIRANYQPSKITTKCASDCTAGVTANCKAIGNLKGVSALAKLSEGIYSANMRAKFKAAGFQCLTDKKYLTGYNYLLPGDVLLYDNHHAATNITKGKYAVETAAMPTGEVTVITNTYSLGDRILKNGIDGDDVKELQTILISLGYSCGSWGADGEFGDATEIAVKKFQLEHNCEVDGEVGSETINALKEAQSIDAVAPKKVQIIGGNCYVRRQPATSGSILGVARENETYNYTGQTAENGWNGITYKNTAAWVSGRYSKLID